MRKNKAVSQEPDEQTEESSSSSESLGRRQAVQKLLHNRDFALLWSGQLLSQIGDQCLLVAAITLISDLSSSPLAMLIPALSIAIPQVIFGLVGGVIADRWNRKQLMIASDVLRAVIVLPILLVGSVQDLWIIYLVAASMALVNVGFYPARNASIPNLVSSDLLVTANGLIQGSYVISLIVGPALAGFAIEKWPPLAILVNSGTFIISAVSITVMNFPEAGTSADAEDNGVWEDMKAGLNFIRYNRTLSKVLVIMAIAMVGIGAIMLLAIPHLKSELGAGGLEYGIAMSMLGVGSVVGGVLVSRLSRRLSTSVIVGGMLVLGGAAIIAFAFASSYFVVLSSVAVIGMCVVVIRGALSAVSQALSPDAVRGRVQSAVTLIVSATTALSEGFSALLGSIIGVQSVFVAAGLLTALTGLIAVFALRGTSQVMRPAVREVA